MPEKSYAFKGYYFASRGYVVFSVGYRLMQDQGNIPERVAWPPVGESLRAQEIKFMRPTSHIYPSLRDGRAAVRYVRASAKRWNVDPGRIAAYGVSAGGIIATALGLINNEGEKTQGIL